VDGSPIKPLGRFIPLKFIGPFIICSVIPFLSVSVCSRLMATNLWSDNIPYPRYICNICGLADNFNGFIPAEHSYHHRFSLTCDICHLVLHNLRLAHIHLSNHQPPLIRRACPLPPSPPPATPVSPTNDLSSIRGSASAVPETMESPSLHLTPPEVVQTPDTSPSLQPAQHSPRPPPTSTMPSPQSATSGDEITRLRARLRHVTAHLVGLAAMTAQLPPLTADMPLMAATLAIRAHFTVPPSPASASFRRLLGTNFSSALPQARSMSAPDIASAMLPLYEHWYNEAYSDYVMLCKFPSWFRGAWSGSIGSLRFSSLFSFVACLRAAALH